MSRTEKSSNEKIAVSIDDFTVFKLAIEDLLENEADPKVKTAIIQKVVHKIIIKNETVEVYFYVGEKHYKRELAIASSLSDALAPEKRHTNPIPVFHGNPKTSELLFLKPNVFELSDKNFYDTGSNSLKNGSENVT